MSGEIKQFFFPRQVKALQPKVNPRLTIDIIDEPESLANEQDTFIPFGKNSPHAFAAKQKFGPVLQQSTPRHQPYAQSNTNPTRTVSEKQLIPPKSPQHYHFAVKSNLNAMRQHIDRSSSEKQLRNLKQQTAADRPATPQNLSNQMMARFQDTPGKIVQSSVNSPKYRARSASSNSSPQFDKSQNRIGRNVNLQNSNSLKQIVTKIDIASGEAAYKQHLFQTFQAMRFIRHIRPVDQLQLAQKQVNLPKRPGYEHKKTVVFDLDETLVHCCERPDQGQVVVQITFPSGAKTQAGINIRPFAKECLIAANRLFEVIVFTASHKCYADEVLDYLDPTGQLIHHRLYRDNCIITDGVHIKDLRILQDRRMEDIVIIDNAAYSFAYQLHNGIPIISWSSDMYDRELYNLIEYLKILAQVEDVRKLNRQTFHLDTFYNDFRHHYPTEEKENCS